jgi:hypothetical protein
MLTRIPNGYECARPARAAGLAGLRRPGGAPPQGRVPHPGGDPNDRQHTRGPRREAPGDRPGTFPHHRHGVQHRRGREPIVQPERQGRTTCRRTGAGQDELGQPDRGATVHGLRGHVRADLHLRWSPDRQAGARARRRRPPHPRPIRLRRDDRRHLLLQLPRWVRTDERLRVRSRRGTPRRAVGTAWGASG